MKDSDRKNPVDKEWFEARLRDKGMSLRALARFAQTNPSNLSRVFLGRRPIKIEQALDMSLALDVPLDEILRRAGLSVPQKNLPIVALADASLRILDKDLPGDLPVIPAPSFLPPNAEAVICHTASSPVYGWIFAYAPSDELQPAAVGRLALLRLRDNTEHIRFLKPSLTPGRFDLGSFLCARPVKAVEIATATPVLYIRP